ncbi:hypothetical protein C6A88_08025, partial [Mycolicibacterium austroafricanum]
DDLIRGMPPALVRCHVVVDSSCPNTRATESHNDWTTTRGSPQRAQAGRVRPPFEASSLGIRLVNSHRLMNSHHRLDKRTPPRYRGPS